MHDALRDKLQSELAQVGWRDLRQHAGRGALFLVGAGLSLLEATLAIARDDKAAVEAWLRDGSLSRPTPQQLADWESEPDKPFESLIVQPFVIAREVTARA
ncbi:MAG: DUF2288 domain-containing protein [Myxococcales bacterium]|jgi:hypothetical protein